MVFHLDTLGTCFCSSLHYCSSLDLKKVAQLLSCTEPSLTSLCCRKLKRMLVFQNMAMVLHLLMGVQSTVPTSDCFLVKSLKVMSCGHLGLRVSCFTQQVCCCSVTPPADTTFVLKEPEDVTNFKPHFHCQGMSYTCEPISGFFKLI